jgi:hypothetical protein
MAKKKSKTSVPLYAGLAAVGAGIYYFATKPTPREAAIKTIVSGLKLTDPAILSVMNTRSDGYLSAWAYAVANKKPFFPAITQNQGSPTWYLGKFDTLTGSRKLYASVGNVAQTLNVIKVFATEPAQLLQAQKMVLSTGATGYKF